MRTPSLLLWTVFPLLLPGCETTSAAEAGENATQARETDLLFREWSKSGSPGCALGVIQDGRLVYARGYGMANLEFHRPLTPRSVFRIASVSKQFTAACIVLLAEQGKLSVDDDVRKHLPELPKYDNVVTIRHMLTHTSGLPEYLNLLAESGHYTRHLDYFTGDEALRSLATAKHPDFPAGEKYAYSNSNYLLMSMIVKRVSGQSLREVAHENIFKPLGMKSTHFHDDVTAIVENRATGYAAKRGGGFKIHETSLDIVGDGGVFTTIEDLYLWDQNFYDNRLGKGGPAFLERMQTPGVLNSGVKIRYAFGLGVDEHQGMRRVSHGGSWVGFRTNMTRFPDRQLTVICLCNLREMNAGKLAAQVAEIWLAEQPSPRRFP